MGRVLGLLAVGCWLASCGDDEGGGDGGFDSGMACPPGASCSMTLDASTDASIDASMTPTDEPEMFTCPMDGGADALQCTVPKFNFDYFIDAGVTMLGPIDIGALPPEARDALISPQGCCTEEGKCGVTERMFTGGGLCFEQDQPGDQDGQCPDEVLTISADSMIPIPGCCKPTNECGLMLAPLGVGCAERSVLIGLLPAGGQLPDGGIAGSLPCNYGNPGGGNDGGSDDGG